MKRRFLARILAFLIAISILPITAFAEDTGTIFTVDGIRYRVLDSTQKTVEVIHSTSDHAVSNIPDSTYTGDVVIPATVSNNSEEYRVIGIDAMAFLCAKITSISLPEGLEYIDGAAFASSTLTSAIIPATVTRLGGGDNNTAVFWGGGNAACDITSITFAAGSKLETIADGAFQGCDSLNSLEIPAGVVDLGLDSIAQHGARNLGALNGWSNAKNVSFASGSPYENIAGVLYQGDKLIVALDDQLQTVTVRDGTTEVGDAAFYMCTKLSSVNLPEGLETIGDEAFNFAPNLGAPIIPGMPDNMRPVGADPANILDQINIPSSVTIIGDNFLKGAVKEDGTSVVIMQGNVPPTFGTGVFEGAKNEGYNGLKIYYPRDAADQYEQALDDFIPDNAEGGQDQNLDYGLTLQNASIYIENSNIFTAIVPEGASLTVSSNNPTVATAEASGNTITVTGVSAGTATITASITLNNITLITDTCTVTVTAQPVTPDPEPEPTPDPEPSDPGSSSGGSTSVRRYNIEADAGRGGDISPDGRVRVRRGENQTFRITADDGWEIADVEVDGESVGAVERYTFENVRTDHTISVTFRQIVTQPEEPETPALPFTDVAEGDWYHDAVAYCWENGIMDGTSGTVFAPNLLLNRAMMAQVLYNLAGGTPAAAAGFPDVAASAWYADAVNWAAANGYVTGYDNGSYGPEDNLTREQMAAILYRYAGSPEPTGTLDGFADAASASAYAVDALRWAVGEGLLTGKDGGRLDPTGTASRAELAQILARFAG